jgi:hypothetical protein
LYLELKEELAAAKKIKESFTNTTPTIVDESETTTKKFV